MLTDNADATNVCYHGYYGCERTVAWIGEKYQGNAALCNRRKGISDDGEGFVPIELVENNGLKRNQVCGSCLRIYDKLKES